MNIHHTAIIDLEAKLGLNVEIGPYVVIDGNVKIGDRTSVESHVVIESNVRIGADNVIGHGAIIGTAPQDLSFEEERTTHVEIGNENVIREHCTIHRGSADGSATRIGNNNFLMAGAHVGHNCDIGNNVIIANNCLLGGHVQVGDGAFLGGGCVFHQKMSVGRLAITQGASAFSKDIPPFVIAAERNYVFGLNVIGLRRAGFSAKDRDEIKAVFKLIYASDFNVSQALEKAKTMGVGNVAREFLDFVANAKKRGICPLKRGDGGTGSVPSDAMGRHGGRSPS
jgi:UDP-N-acetylglucosamine acyltransferase